MADGSITIDSRLNNADFKASAKELATAIKNLQATANKTSANMAKSATGYGNAMRTSIQAAKAFKSELGELESKAADLRDQLESKGSTVKPWVEKTREIQKLETELTKANQLAEELGETKGFDSTEYAKADEAAETLVIRLRELQKERDALERPTDAAIMDFTQGEHALQQMEAQITEMRAASIEAGGGFQILARNVGTAAGALARMAGGAILSFLRKLASGAKNAAIQLMKLAGRAVQTGIQKIGQLASGAAKHLFNLGKSSGKANGGFKVGLKTILKYGLGIRSLFFLFRKLRSAISDGLGEIGKQNPQVRAALNSMKASLNGLKASLGAAFAPILTAVAPALTTLINLLTTAINAIGAFFAALTGQAYFSKATAAVESVGGAAKSSSGSVKELKRQLAGFDDLEILSQTDASGGGGGGGGGSGSGLTYENIPIDSGIKDFADKLKALWEASDFTGIGELIAEKINGAFAKAKELISWKNVEGKVTKAVNAITGIFNGLVSGVKWDLIGQTFAEGVNTLVKTFDNFIIRLDLPGLARGLTSALNNFVKHVEWRSVGDLAAHWCGTIIKSIKEAVLNFEWGDTGRKFASALNQFFKHGELWEDAGRTVNGAILGILDFTKQFVITFDAKQAALNVKAALDKIKWGDIATEFWDTVRIAFAKAGDFFSIILGDIKEPKPSVIKPAADKLGQQLQTELDKQAGSYNANLSDYTSADGIAKILGDVVTAVLKKVDDWISKLDFTDLGTKIYNFLNDLPWETWGNLLADALTNLFSGLGELILSSFYGEQWFKEEWVQNMFPKLSQKGESDYQLKHGTLSERLYQMAWRTDDKKLSDAYFWASNFADSIEHFSVEKSIGEPINKAITSFKDLFGLGGSSGSSGQLNWQTVQELDRYDWQKVWGDWVEADDKNTKAIEENTETLERPDFSFLTEDQEQSFIVEWGNLGADQFFWDFITGNEEVSVDVGTNFVPDGQPSNSRFANKGLGAWVKQICDPKTPVEQKVALMKQGWTTIANFIGTNKPLSAMIDLLKHNFTSIIYWLTGNWNGLVTTKIDLKSGFGKFVNWLTDNTNGTTTPSVALKNTFGKFVNWVTGTTDGTTTATVNLKNGWGKILKFITGDDNGVVTATVKIQKQKNNSLTWTVTQSKLANNQIVMMAQAMGGYITRGGMAGSFASGGVIRGGVKKWWNTIPRYAAGGFNHGTLFAAGEAGPEIVGHIGGRTEVLNKSQLAQTMYNAVVNGITTALNGLHFRMPTMATGSVMPYEIAAQIERSNLQLQNTMNANNEDLIQSIISAVTSQTLAIVAAINSLANSTSRSGGGMSSQQIIEEINRRTQMYSRSPIMGV